VQILASKVLNPRALKAKNNLVGFKTVLQTGTVRSRFVTLQESRQDGLLVFVFHFTLACQPVSSVGAILLNTAHYRPL
jgi:hypothetical protein